MLIIPAIDLKEGSCVRLRQGRMGQVTIYADDPKDLVEQYKLAGANRLHIVDLDGAFAGATQQQELIKNLINKKIAIQLGGGIRTLAQAQYWISCGVSKIVLGSIAICDMPLASSIINLIGATNIILAIDVKFEQDRCIPMIRGWQDQSNTTIWQLLKFYYTQGIRQVLCTDIACDGMMNGPNFALYEEAIQRFPDCLWQASGGVRDVADLSRLHAIGLSAVILGRTLYEGNLELNRCIKEFSLC